MGGVAAGGSSCPRLGSSSSLKKKKRKPRAPSPLRVPRGLLCPPSRPRNYRQPGAGALPGRATPSASHLPPPSPPCCPPISRSFLGRTFASLSLPSWKFPLTLKDERRRKNENYPKETAAPGQGWLEAKRKGGGRLCNRPALASLLHRSQARTTVATSAFLLAREVMPAARDTPWWRRR